MLIYIDERKLVLEVLHVHVRYPITDILVSLEHDLFSLWSARNPVCECVTCYAIPIVLNLGDGEDVSNAFLLIHISKRPSIPLRMLLVTPALQFSLITVFNLQMLFRHHVTKMEW